MEKVIPETIKEEIKFISKEIEYQVDEFGIAHQLNPQPFEYNEDYVAIYSKPEYAKKTLELSKLRLEFILKSIKYMPNSIFDFGYGRGDFIKHCSSFVGKVYGYDITGLQVPENCIRVEEFVPADVYTFWDSLEHCPDINFVKELPCNYLAISLPYCHKYGGEWFDNWKHRKPHEHLHHFNRESLEEFFVAMGYSLLAFSDIEDSVRIPVDNRQNILTAIFKRF